MSHVLANSWPNRVHGIGWAAFWIYWLVTTVTPQRSRLANEAKHSDDDQLGAQVSDMALINPFNHLNRSTHQPPVTTRPFTGDKGMGTADSHDPEVVSGAVLPAPQAG
jgi:hypothetical protein